MFLSVENIKTLNSDKYISDEDFSHEFKIYPQKNDILMTRIGDVGTVNIVQDNHPKAYYVSLALIKPINIYPKFLLFSIMSSFTQRQIWQRTLHVAFPKKINKNEIGKVEINFPKKESEQENMANLLNVISKLVFYNQQQLSLYQRMKTALLQKMFPADGELVPRIRFTDFHDNWRKKKLKDVGSTLSGVGFPNSEQNGKKGIPFFKVSDMNTFENKEEMKISNNYVTRDQIQRNKWKTIKNNSIIFAKVGAAIFLNRKKMVNQEFLIDNNIMAYKYGSSWDDGFVKNVFETINLSKYAQIGALPSYSAKDIENINIKLTDLNEQRNIGKLFDEINIQERDINNKINHLLNLKKYLLQKILI